LSYAHCPRCWLTVRLTPGASAPAACPRCLARHSLSLPMYASGVPASGSLAAHRDGVGRARRFASESDRSAASAS
jgi:hypothetical protein